MALRSITVHFKHHAPGDVEAQVAYEDDMGANAFRVFDAPSEQEAVQTVTHNALSVIMYMNIHGELPPTYNMAPLETIP